MYFCQCLFPDPKMLSPFQTVRRVEGKEEEITRRLLEVLQRPPPPAPAPPPPPPPPAPPPPPPAPAPPPPPPPLSEDEHFFKGILPSLQRLPPHAKEEVKFQIHKLLHEANNYYNPVMFNLDN